MIRVLDPQKLTRWPVPKSSSEIFRFVAIRYLPLYLVPDHPVESVVSLPLVLTVRPIDLLDVAGPIVMPDRGGGQGCLVGFGGGCLAVAIIVPVMSHLVARIRHIGQIADVIVVEFCSGRSNRRRFFAEIHVVHIGCEN